ncbi:replication protein [Candidatus Falkowbacteria bacterium]|nr:replication protein [Candidatus Falkowbacteria bacterium]
MKELTPINSRIIESAAEIRIEEAAEIEYQHGILCQVGLPRKKTEGQFFERNFKNASICVTAGKLWDGKKWVMQPLPYGPKPRLALIHINGEAIRKQNPQIEIGSSCAEFLRRIGLPDQDGRTYSLFKKQMMALAAAELSLGFTTHNEAVTVNARPIKEFRAWISNSEHQTSLWPGELTLSRDYFDSLLTHAVPLDPRALGALAHSALALDVYAFLARRLHELNKAVKVPFASFKEQFGQEYANDKNFKNKFLLAMKQVLAVYPEAKIQRVTGGLLLIPSHPPIKTTPKGHRIAKEEIKPIQATTTAPMLTERTREQFWGVCQGLDIYACQADFDSWLQGKAQPKDYQKAFLGFAKKWGKGKN